MLKTKDLPKAVEMEAKRKALLADVIRLQRLLNEDVGKRIAITLYDQPARPDRSSQSVAGWDIDINSTPDYTAVRQAILAAVQQGKTEALQQIIEKLTAIGVEVGA